ncbi:MAG: Xaa-Pro peptidase family protein [Pseudomonadota bacterium]
MIPSPTAAAPRSLAARHLHFSEAEFESRIERTRAAMAARGFDAMLLFSQESMYWLTGYDTFGYCFFQCLVLRKDGPLNLLTRSADLRQAQFTSVIDDIRIWKDAGDANPAEDLRELLEELGLQGAKFGVETDTPGLTAFNFRRIAQAFKGWAALGEASDIVPKLRLVKSPAEIAYVRRAAEITDKAFEAARPLIADGAGEALILAAMQGEVFARDGDYAGNEFIIGSGPGGLLCRYYSGRRQLSEQDQLTLEWSAAYRHYHAPAMRTVVIGSPRSEHERMHVAAREALLACEAAIKPGQPMGDVFETHATTLDRAGYGHARLNACGYSVGARFSPCWMDSFMFYEGATTPMQPGMTFFLHMILMDSDTGAAMSLGRTSLVTEDGAEPLSGLPLSLDVVRQISE